MNLFEKLSAITTELNAIAKDMYVSMGGDGRNSYKAVSEGNVLSAVKPLEAKYRIYSYPQSRRIVDSDLVTTSKTYNGNTTETTKYFMRVETVYRFVDVDDPKSFIDITTYGDGLDSGDKAPGKAMTYGDKYALLKAYKIITGDDPDQTASDEGKTTRAKKQAPNNPTPEQLNMLAAELERTGISCHSMLNSYGVARPADMTVEMYVDAMNKLKDRPTKKEKGNE